MYVSTIYDCVCYYAIVYLLFHVYAFPFGVLRYIILRYIIIFFLFSLFSLCCFILHFIFYIMFSFPFCSLFSVAYQVML